MSLKDRVAIITGSSMGIGEGVAKLFLENGAKVVINSRDQGRADAMAAKFEAMGFKGSVLPVAGDVASKADCERLVETTRAMWDRVDILVNNAGINAIGPSVDLDAESWKRVLSVNVDGCFFMAQTCAKLAFIPQKSGSIINIASIFGVTGHSMRACYATSKHALIGMTKVLAVEWAPHNIRVNALCPGYIMTPLEVTDSTTGDYTVADIERRTPLGRYGTVEEQAEACLWLASDASSYTTGSVLMSDGGWTAYGGW